MNNLQNELSLKQFARDALLFNGALGLLLVGSLRWNAEIWAHDYPPDIKEKFGPISPRTKKQSAIIAVPFFIILFGSVIGSNLKLKQRNGGQLSLTAAFANAFALIFSFWFLDLTILDWLMFVRYTPDWVILPGTEGMAGYDDYMFHLKAHSKALPMLAGSALVFALLTASWPWHINNH
ncbi:MAG: hypothetical protein GWP17_02970 [Aquificales bacterium]|nr:hypothetical protein [Aquificales bacterium]